MVIGHTVLHHQCLVEIWPPALVRGMVWGLDFFSGCLLENQIILFSFLGLMFQDVLEGF